MDFSFHGCKGSLAIGKLSLPRFETRIGFTNDVDPAFPTHNLAVGVTVF